MAPEGRPGEPPQITKKGQVSHVDESVQSNVGPNLTEPVLGYLSAATFDGLGTCGGLLVVNPLGRPLEFHCTSPVVSNRTQQILFGKSLGQFIYCEQIAKALCAELRQPPILLLTDIPEMQEFANQTDVPLVFVSRDSPEWSESSQESNVLRFGETTVRFTRPWNIAGPEALILNRLHHSIPVEEPFERISQALEEAHASAR